MLHQNGENTAHYVDSIGFQQVPEFLQEQAQQTPVFDKLSPEQQQALSDTVKDTLQLLVDADKRIYGDVTGKTLEAIAAQGYSYKGGQLEKQQPEATPRKPYDGRNRQNAARELLHYRHEPRTDRSGGLWFSSCVGGREVSHYGKWHTGLCHSRRAAAAGYPLKHVEDIVEQNDNNFDGIINNTPQTPTVADLEQRAKAGEAISVTDLAKAVKAEKREQPQKKPSILKKLDEYKKQAAQQPKDKQKEQKKDWRFDSMNIRFTIEEENIIAIYAEDSRETTLENILAAMPYMDEDMRQLAAAAVKKLQAMTDSEFSEREFILTDEE